MSKFVLSSMREEAFEEFSKAACYFFFGGAGVAVSIAYITFVAFTLLSFLGILLSGGLVVYGMVYAEKITNRIKEFEPEDFKYRK